MYRLVDAREDARDLKHGSRKSGSAGADGKESIRRLESQKSTVRSARALKPMNCPSHCVIFGSARRSYRELPWRVADFGRLHRYERGGVVHGLARVRSFCQDDAHIFCAPEQARRRDRRASSASSTRSTRRSASRRSTSSSRRAPEKRIGTRRAVGHEPRARSPRRFSEPSSAVRDAPRRGRVLRTEARVPRADALKRSWQLGTIQFDSACPSASTSQYIGDDGKEHRPVMLHRAIFGSLERFFGVYLEHCGGNFPAWLAPEQAIALTVSEKQHDYAQRGLQQT